MEHPSILPILKQIPIFSGLSEEDHKEIIKNIILNYYPVSHVFFHENDPHDSGSMYIIKRGMVKVTRKNDSGGETEVAVLNDNDFFGEMALVLREKRNATATAISDVEVFELKKTDFIKLMETSPALAEKISATFIQREKTNNKYDPALL